MQALELAFLPSLVATAATAKTTAPGEGKAKRTGEDTGINRVFMMAINEPSAQETGKPISLTYEAVRRHTS